MDSVACEEGALVVATTLAMLVLCALSGALLVLCVVLSRAYGTTRVSSYWLADDVKQQTLTIPPPSSLALYTYGTVSLVLMCLSNITSQSLSSYIFVHVQRFMKNGLYL